jgi:hypothetical protein
MKLFNRLPIITLVLVFLFSSCMNENNTIEGSGKILTNTQTLNPFTEIEIENGCTIEVVLGAENKVEFSDYENIIEHLKFEVVDNKLIIKTADNISIINSEAKAKIYVKGDLTKIFIVGSSTVDLLHSFFGLNELSISGSGTINVEQDIITPFINCSISGSGTMNLLKINAATADCDVSGSGTISITVSESLQATISGSGDIQYQGNPSLTKDITGSGSVEKL